jgi:LysM repeat protein
LRDIWDSIFRRAPEPSTGVKECRRRREGGSRQPSLFTMRSFAVTALALFFCGIATAAEPAVEFSGVLTENGKARVALTDKATGFTRWVESGAEFNGYTVANYDAKEETVTVKKDGAEYRLPLVSSKSHSSTTSVASNGGSGGALVPASASGSAGMPTGPTPAPAASGAPAGVPPPAVPTAPPITPGPPPPATAPSTATGASATPPPAAPLDTPTAVPQQPPASGTMTYVAQPGDTLAKIAATSGLSVSQLQALNPGVNPTAIQAGQAIRIR